MNKISQYEKIDIGDYIDAIALQPYSKNNRKNSWVGFSKQINPKWDLELIITEKGDAQSGFLGKFRVIQIKDNKVIAINSLYFCSKMLNKSKVIKCIDSFIDIVRFKDRIYGKKEVKILKSILNYYMQCWSLESVSRFEYYYGLGFPSIEECRKIKNLIYDVIDQIIHNNADILNDRIGELLNTNIIYELENFKKYLNRYNQNLNIPIYGKSNKKKIISEKSVIRILSQQEIEKLNFAKNTHEKTLQILKKELKRLCYNPEEGLFIDCYAYIHNKPAIFEVKSLNGANELHQIRAAVSQLYEYRYRHRYKNASLWLVLSQAPTTEWILDYLINDRKINVLWLENETLVGSSKLE